MRRTIGMLITGLSVCGICVGCGPSQGGSGGSTTPATPGTAGGAKVCTAAMETGRRVDTSKIPSIQKGQTTMAQIRELFGDPGKTFPVTNHPLGCTQRYIYVWAKCVVGMPARSEALVVDFTPAGVVCSHGFARVPKQSGGAPAVGTGEPAPGTPPAGGGESLSPQP